jgi:hypothetical protein
MRMHHLQWWDTRMRRKLLMATTLLTGLATVPANADFVFSSVIDTTGLGFGDVHRLQDVQEPTGQGNGIETGTVAPTPVTITPVVTTGQTACNGNDKCSTPTLTALGWTTGANVGIGIDISQTGALSDGLNLNNFGVNIYDATGTTILATFSLGSPFLITAAQGHDGPGNGTDVFNFVLNAAEQAQFNAFHFSGNDVVGSFTNFGCSGAVSPTCQPANDGPDSLLAFQQPAAVPGPVVGAGLPGLFGLMMLGLARWRRLRNSFGLAA